MKEKIIDAAGKTWQYLARNGETDISVLPKRLKEKNNIVFQSLGWLAREDKINYTHRDKKTIVSLSDPEMRIFNSVSQNIRQSLETN
ncbi:MAG: winged helix-turn-helix domain-containing protein [Candidatus Omnitrophica bacterium]|nr:winged helix-turn-helix domain-containing protein [Candidatus Omnitrophota bacterium]MBU1810645.1 winged helix-turn-helix domain-containing protein [Candidatus Omnitrophota bacterium]